MCRPENSWISSSNTTLPAVSATRRKWDRVVFPIHAETAELTTWILMPEGKEYRNFRIIRYETGKPEKAEAVKVVTEYLAEDSTILAFKLLSLKPGYTYEVSWTYRSRFVLLRRTGRGLRPVRHFYRIGIVAP